MSCGLSNCPNLLPFYPDKSSNASVSSDFLQVMPPDDFDRAELQSIRDRARRMSIPGSPMKTVEERLYQQLADVADQLDAISARFESDVKEMESNVIVTTVPLKRRPASHGPSRRPF